MLKNEDSRIQILVELNEIRIFFEKLETVLFEKQKNILIGWGMNPDELTGELIDENDILSSTKKLRKLSKAETIIDIFKYNSSIIGSIPIIILEDNTYWSICEEGLTIYEDSIDASKKEEIEVFKDLFPIKDFNPRPRKEGMWHYDLLLKKKKFRISIRPASNDKLYSFEWDINQNQS